MLVDMPVGLLVLQVSTVAFCTGISYVEALPQRKCTSKETNSFTSA